MLLPNTRKIPAAAYSTLSPRRANVSRITNTTVSATSSSLRAMSGPSAAPGAAAPGAHAAFAVTCGEASLRSRDTLHRKRRQRGGDAGLRPVDQLVRIVGVRLGQ